MYKRGTSLIRLTSEEEPTEHKYVNSSLLQYHKNITNYNKNYIYRISVVLKTIYHVWIKNNMYKRGTSLIRLTSEEETTQHKYVNASLLQYHKNITNYNKN